MDFFNSLLVRLHLRKDPEMLSYAIQKMREGSQKRSGRGLPTIRRVRSKIARIIFPSFQIALLCSAGFLLVLWFLPLGSLHSNIPIGDFKDFFLVLWQVQASLLGITFVIVMFLVSNLIKIESTYGRMSGRVVREFLTASKISIILPFCLCSIVYIGVTIFFGNTNQTYQNLFLFISNIALIFYLFYTAFNFFRPRFLEKLRLEHLKDEVSKAIDAEIDRRLSKTILMGQDENFVRYAPLGVVDKSSLQKVTIPVLHARVVSDLRLGKILAYSKTVPITIVKTMGDTLSKDNNVLCYVPEATDLKSVHDIQNCFVLKEISEGVLSDALDGVREETREAIRTGNITKLERVVETYLSLLERFLEQTCSYGIHYDLNAARSTVGFGWPPISEIRRNVVQAVEHAFKEGDLETVRWILYFPKMVANLAIRYSDHYLFHEFVSFYPFIYFLGSRVSDRRTVDLAIDRSWRYLNETSLRVRNLLEDTTEINRIDDLKDYLIQILLTLNNLLKAALDNKDFRSFKEFGFALDDVLKHFHPRTSFFMLESQLASPRVTEEQKNNIRYQLEARKRLVESEERVDGTKNCIWFGLGGWITRLYREQRLSKEEFSTLFSEISARFDNLEKISTTFSLLTRFADTRFGWNFWELSEKREGEVVGIDTQEWLDWFYCIQGIQLTPVSMAQGTPIHPSRLIVEKMEHLKNVCNKTLEEPKKWDSLLNKNAKDKTSNFLLLNQRAADKQVKAEKQWLVEQELSTRLCEDFTNEVVKSWKAAAIMGAIIELLAKSTELTSKAKCKKIRYIGISTLAEKAAFVERWHIGYPGFGQTYGRLLGSRENSLLLNEICASLEVYKKLKRAKICQNLHSAIMKLNTSGFDPCAIFLKDWETLTSLRKDERFRSPRERGLSKMDIIGCRGYFENIPIFLLHECPADCCIVDFSRLGVLIRCRQNNDSRIFLEISITKITDSMARNMIKKNPDFLKDEEGKDKTPETAIFDLKQKVVLNILEKVKFDIKNKKAGLRFQFAN